MKEPKTDSFWVSVALMVEMAVLVLGLWMLVHYYYGPVAGGPVAEAPVAEAPGGKGTGNTHSVPPKKLPFVVRRFSSTP